LSGGDQADKIIPRRARYSKILRRPWLIRLSATTRHLGTLSVRSAGKSKSAVRTVSILEDPLRNKGAQ
jgi:hypothetical protein